MLKTGGSIQSGNSTDFLFTYSEEEKQQNEINRENAKLATSFKYLVVPREILKLGLSSSEVLILSFIDSWLSEDGGKFYFSNKTLSDIFNITEVTVSKVISGLEKKGHIKLHYRRKSNGGQIRFVEIPTYKFFKYQLKENLSSNLKKVYGSSNNISSNNISIVKNLEKSKSNKVNLPNIKTISSTGEGMKKAKDLMRSKGINIK